VEHKTETGTVEHKGCVLAYSVTGEGPPVVLIQGVGVHGGGWKPQVERLSGSYRCLTFDNRGIGKSQPSGSALSVEQMSEDTLVLMDKQGWSAAHLIGHSLGGLVALDLALNHRSRVRSLSLLCTFANGKDATRLTWEILSVGVRTKIGSLRQRRRAFLELILSKEERETTDLDRLAEELEPIFGHDLAVQPKIVMEQLRMARRYDATPRLAELAKMPTLLMFGDEDPIAPPSIGEAIAKGIGTAEFLEFESAAHGLPLRRAEEVNQMLLAHMALIGG